MWNQELIIEAYKNENWHHLLMNKKILFYLDIFQINWIQKKKWVKKFELAVTLDGLDLRKEQEF